MTARLQNFCPELQRKSPPFSVVDEQVSYPEHSLHLFESESLPGAVCGSLAFLGGPAQALDWSSDGNYLVAAAHRKTQSSHQLLHSYTGTAHIQIWRMRLSCQRMFCEMLIRHFGDCVWDAKWRPGNVNSYGTVAAALGNGNLCLYQIPLDANKSETGGPVLADPNPLSVRNSAHVSDVAFSIEWNNDGSIFAAGTMRGCIELHRVRNLDEAKILSSPLWRVSAHESVVTSLKWVSDFLLCSTSHDAYIRLRDSRDPLCVLEQAVDGLAWGLSLCIPENDVAVVGTDNGFLRVTKLNSISTEPVTHKMKKTRIQRASLRDIACVQMNCHQNLNSHATLLVGGAEGELLQCTLPSPLWPKNGRCNIAKTKYDSLLQWETAPVLNSQPVTSGSMGDGKNRKHNSPPNSKKYGKSSTALPIESSLILKLGSSKTEQNEIMKKGKKPKARVKSDISMCAHLYDQRRMITRLAFNRSKNLIAVSTHCGLLTIAPLSEILRGPDDKSSRCEKPIEKKGKARSISKSEDCSSVVKSSRAEQTPATPVVKRKRGRPRKHPLPKDQNVAETRVGEAPKGTSNPPARKKAKLTERKIGTPAPPEEKISRALGKSLTKSSLCSTSINETTDDFPTMKHPSKVCKRAPRTTRDENTGTSSGNQDYSGQSSQKLTALTRISSRSKAIAKAQNIKIRKKKEFVETVQGTSQVLDRPSATDRSNKSEQVDTSQSDACKASVEGNNDGTVEQTGSVRITLRIRRQKQEVDKESVLLRLPIRQRRRKRVKKETARMSGYMASRRKSHPK